MQQLFFCIFHKKIFVFAIIFHHEFSKKELVQLKLLCRSGARPGSWGISFLLSLTLGYVS
jgi:hypothetical protein